MAYGSKQLGALDQIMQMYQQQFGPGAIASGAGTIFQSMQQSPIMAAQMGNIGAASGGIYARTARGLGRRGMSTSGAGTLATGLSRSAGTQMQNEFLAQLYAQALGAAGTNANALAGATGYAGGNIRYPDPHFGSRQLGGFISAIGMGLPAIFQRRQASGG